MAIKLRAVSLANLQWSPLIATAAVYCCPGQSGLGNLTYIRNWLDWLCLAEVINLFARNVVVWSMKPALSRELALDALMMAVWRRKLDSEVITHSDQGSQYGSDD